MAVLAKTIREARDHMLKRIGSLGSTKYEAIAIECINDAISFISTMHDWKFLRTKTTLSTSDATGIIDLPDDLNRVLSIYQTGSERFLTELDAVRFDMEIEAENVTEPSYFSIIGYAQDTTTEAPHIQIQVYTAPESGTTYNLKYIKNMPEYEAADLDKVPIIPPPLWNLVMRKAMTELLKITEASDSDVEVEYAGFTLALGAAKRAETYGSSRRTTFRFRQGLGAHLRDRAGR